MRRVGGSSNKALPRPVGEDPNTRRDAVAKRLLFINKRGTKKLYKLYIKPYISPVTLLIFSALCFVGFAFQNPAQTIHKPYTELYTKLYTEPYILFFEHESCEGSKCVVCCGGVS